MGFLKTLSMEEASKYEFTADVTFYGDDVRTKITQQ